MLATISTFAQKQEDETKIKSIVHLYEKALKKASNKEITQLFTEEGVIILQGAPTIIGTEKIQSFYTSLFNNLSFSLEFHIEEVVHMSPQWALVRTKTSGKVNVLANSTSNPAKGHEIFIIKKQADDSWKIARYAGTSSK